MRQHRGVRVKEGQYGFGWEVGGRFMDAIDHSDVALRFAQRHHHPTADTHLRSEGRRQAVGIYAIERKREYHIDVEHCLDFTFL